MAVAKEGEKLSGSRFIRFITDGMRNITPASARMILESFVFIN